MAFRSTIERQKAAARRRRRPIKKLQAGISSTEQRLIALEEQIRLLVRANISNRLGAFERRLRNLSDQHQAEFVPLFWRCEGCGRQNRSPSFAAALHLLRCAQCGCGPMNDYADLLAHRESQKVPTSNGCVEQAEEAFGESSESRTLGLSDREKKTAAFGAMYGAGNAVRERMGVDHEVHSDAPDCPGEPAERLR